MKNIFYLFLILLFASCATRAIKSPTNSISDNGYFQITEVSTDDTYGYSAKNPIKVGGVKDSRGPLNEKMYLRALTGPNGEEVTFEREGSCCGFKTKNGFNGYGLLDKYKVKIDGLKKEFYLYLNMYDGGELKAPVGFKFKK